MRLDKQARAIDTATRKRHYRSSGSWAFAALKMDRAALTIGLVAFAWRALGGSYLLRKFPVLYFRSRNCRAKRATGPLRIRSPVPLEIRRLPLRPVTQSASAASVGCRRQTTGPSTATRPSAYTRPDRQRARREGRRRPRHGRRHESSGGTQRPAKDPRRYDHASKERDHTLSRGVTIGTRFVRLAKAATAFALAGVGAWSHAHGATARAEIQIGLCGSPADIERALELRPREAPYEVWQFDDASLTLLAQGAAPPIADAYPARSELTLKIADQNCERLAPGLGAGARGKMRIRCLRRAAGRRRVVEQYARRETRQATSSPAG